MKEELGFGPGNQLSSMNMYFSIGTIVGGVCSGVIMHINCMCSGSSSGCSNLRHGLVSSIARLLVPQV